MKRLDASAGIAIGPILFVLAILGLVAAVIASGGSTSFGNAGNTDRVFTDVLGQANLIRSKIQECRMQYIVNGTNYAAGDCAGDSYPCSDQTDGTAVSALTCPNDPLDGASNERSLWSGLRVASLAPPTKGFDAWTYFNAGNSGGRCFWTAPTSGSSDTSAVQGLKRVAKKFTSTELTYESGAAAQKFIVFVTLPTGAIDSHCELP